MGDYLIRARGAENYMRAFVATSRDLVDEARRLHGLSPVATAALGRTLTAASMMGVMMKNEQDVLTIIFDGDGPIGGITATSDSHGRVKGYVKNPSVMLPPSPKGKLDVGRAVGHGYLRVIRDTGLKEPYSGEVAIHSGEIADDLTYYFAESEQTPSVVGLGVLMNHGNTVREAGGFIIQLMPGAPDELVSELERRFTGVTSVTDLLKNGGTPESILADLLGGFNMVIEGRDEISYYCNCSRSRVTRSLIAIGKHEIEDMIKDGKPVTLTCGFCGKSYTFTPDDLKVILEAAK